MQTIPGVENVGLLNNPPLDAGGWTATVFKDGAIDLRPANAAATTNWFNISPGYLGAAGHLFGPEETSPGMMTRTRHASASSIASSPSSSSAPSPTPWALLQVAGWNARPCGGRCRRRKISQPHRDPQTRDVPAHPAGPFERIVAGRARQGQSPGCGRRHANPGCTSSTPVSPLTSSPGDRKWASPSSLPRSQRLAGRAWPHGRDALHHRNLWNGSVLGQQTSARAGHSHRAGSTALVRAGCGAGTSPASPCYWLGSRTNSRTHGNARARVHRVPGVSARSLWSSPASWSRWAPWDS
jgi:hypothetical protein